VNFRSRAKLLVFNQLDVLFHKIEPETRSAPNRKFTPPRKESKEERIKSGITPKSEVKNGWSRHLRLTMGGAGLQACIIAA
jgi:hypothetical protein